MNEGRGESDRMVEGKEDYGVMRMHRYLWTIKSGASFEIVDSEHPLADHTRIYDHLESRGCA